MHHIRKVLLAAAMAFLCLGSAFPAFADEPVGTDVTVIEETEDDTPRYLNKKSGFILVSHDRRFMDECVDHVLSLNKSTIEVVQGNFTTWWDNKRQRDEWEAQENEKLKKEIGRLRVSARQTERWSDAVEKTKKGTKTGSIQLITIKPRMGLERANFFVKNMANKKPRVN